MALIFAAAVGYYLDHGPRFRSKKGDEETLRLLRAPRLLPDVVFTDGEGYSVRLSTYRGKVILLNIWATWCAPCRKEMPALDRLQSILRGPSFEVIAVSVDREGLPVIKAFYRMAGIRQLHIYFDKSGQVMSDLGVAAIPTTLLIDRNGNEIARKVGPVEWDSPALIKLIRDYLDASLDTSEQLEKALPSPSQ